MRSRPAVFVLSLLVFAAVSRPAAADRDAARELFRSGRAAYERGDYVAAAHAFEQAYTEDDTAAALYNAGLSWHAARRLARAADRYERALADGDLDPELAREARRLLSEILPELGVIVVEAPDGVVSLPDEPSVAVPARVRVAPGTHRLLLTRKGGRQLVREVSVRAGGTERVRFEERPLQKARVRERPSPPREDGPSAQRLLGWTALGVSLAASGAAIYLGTRAVSARDEWVDSNLEDLDAHDRAVTLRTWTNVAWGGALAFGATGVVLLLTDQRQEPTVGLRLGPSGAGASYRTSF